MDFDTQFIRIFSGEQPTERRRDVIDLEYIKSEAAHYERQRQARLAEKVREAREVWRLAEQAASEARMRYIEAIAVYDVRILDGKP